MSDVKKDRPWCCVDKRCTPLVISHDHVDVGVSEPGKSIFCWGVMERAVEFVYDGIPHKNGCSLCMYTPLKGVLRYQVNKEDVELFKIGAERMLEKLGDLERVGHG